MAFNDRYVTQGAAGGGDGSSGSPWTFAEAVSNYAAGDRINVKADATYSLGATTFATSATDSAPVHVRGYTTTIGDGGKPALSLSAIATFSGKGITFESFALTATHSSRVFQSSGGNIFMGVDVIQTTNGYGFTLDDGDVGVNCNVDISTATSASRYGIGAENAVLIGCTVKVTGGTAFKFGAAGRDLYHTERCLAVGDGSAGSIGVSFPDIGDGVGRLAIASGMTLHDVETGITIAGGVDAADTSGCAYIADNTIYGVSTAISVTGGNIARIFLSGNAIGDVSTARYSGLGDAIVHNDITLTADPFTDSASGDFSPNNTAGGGALIRGAAIQAPVPL